MRAGERETVKERETREEAAGCGLIYKNKKLKTRLLVIHKRATYMICQPAHMRRERAPFFIAYSNETQSSGTGVADRTRIAEGHAQFVRLWAATAKHANDRPRHVRHHIQLRSGNDCRGAGRSRSLPDAPPTCGIGQNAGHLRLRKAT